MEYLSSTFPTFHFQIRTKHSSQLSFEACFFASLVPNAYDDDYLRSSLLTMNVEHFSQRTSPSLNDWKKTFSIAKAKEVGSGGSGIVYEINKDLVLKAFAGDENGRDDLQRELEIYEKLQSEDGSEFVVKCIGQWSFGLVLERHCVTLRKYLEGRSPLSPPPFARQLAQDGYGAVQFLQKNGIIHGDVGCKNFLLTIDHRLKICDFAGSKLGDKEAWVSYEARSQHPALVGMGKQPTDKTDIFALGSVFFEIYTCRPPLASASNLEVRQKFSAGDFPYEQLPHKDLRKVVSLCWEGGYEDVSEICSALALLASYDSVCVS